MASQEDLDRMLAGCVPQHEPAPSLRLREAVERALCSCYVASGEPPPHRTTCPAYPAPGSLLDRVLRALAAAGLAAGAEELRLRAALRTAEERTSTQYDRGLKVACNVCGKFMHQGGHLEDCPFAALAAPLSLDAEALAALLALPGTLRRSGNELEARGGSSSESDGLHAAAAELRAVLRRLGLEGAG
jgi:hypothetical protein